ncbi:hypothetical protein D3C81_1128570 [compost metagenome]
MGAPGAMIILRNFNDLYKGIDLNTFEEIELSRELKQQFTRGFYIDYQENKIGIIATVNGPLFFYNDNVYELQINNFDCYIQHYRDKNIFYFVWNGTLEYKISYYRMLYREGGKWEDDRVNDFFAWLSHAVKKKRFYSFYTIQETSSAC